MNDTTPVDIQPFIDRLQDSDQYIRLRSVEILGKLGNPAAVPALMAALFDPANTAKLGKGIFAQKSVQNLVTDALVQIGGSAVVTELEKLLNDQDPNWRLLAMALLVRVASSDQRSRVIGVLQGVLTDDNVQIRTTAIEALREIIFED